MLIDAPRRTHCLLSGPPDGHLDAPRPSRRTERPLGRTIQGGKVAITQWYTKPNDYDLMCPGYDTPAAMAKYFHTF